MRLALALFLLVALVSPGLAAAGPDAASQEASAPLSIVGDAALDRIAEAQAWSGTGVASDPYRLPRLNVSLPSSGASVGIRLQDTSRHLVIEGTTVWSSTGRGTGVSLTNASNVTLRGLYVDHLSTGILVDRSKSVALLHNTVLHAESGIRLVATFGAYVVGNDVHISDRSYHLERSQRNYFEGNRASVAYGQFGFYFHEETSYDNEIGTSNVVNDAPMQWHVRLMGTPTQKARLSGIEAHTMGLNNVAQFLCYQCDWLELERIAASEGTEAGILILDSKRVVLRAPFAEKNRVGIEVRGGWGSLVENAEVERNKLDGLALVDESEMRVHGLRASQNGRAGLSAIGGGGHVVVDAFVTGNGAGVAFDRSASNVLRDVTAIENRGEGVAIGRGRGDTLERVEAHRNGGSGVVVSFADAKHETIVKMVNATGNGLDGVRLDRLSVVTLEGVEARRNGGAGVHLTGVQASSVRGVAVAENKGDGLRVGGASEANAMEWVTSRDNRGFGVSFSSVGPGNRLVDSTVSNHSANVFLNRAGGTVFDRVDITAARGQFGFRFEDEESYDVSLDRSNRVNGEPVLWLVRVTGTRSDPVVLDDLVATQPLVTNVGQIVLYKASHVVVRDALGTDGVRGLVVHTSSNVTVERGRFENDTVGVELVRTLYSRVVGVETPRSGTAIRLTSTSDSSVVDTRAVGASQGVVLDASSRGNIVERTNGTDVKGKILGDPSLREGTLLANNFLVDAGHDKFVMPGENVTFSTAMLSVPRDHEPVIRQTWDYGDGSAATSDGPGVFRPTVRFPAEGNFTITYQVETTSGRTFADSVRVLVLETPSAPLNVSANGTNETMRVAWLPPANAAWPVVYEVLRANATGTFVPLARLDNETSFIDAEAAWNESYQYRVRAVRAEHAPLAGPWSESAAARLLKVVPLPEVVRLERTEATVSAAEDAAPENAAFPVRLAALGAAGLAAVVLFIGGQIVQGRR